MIRIVTILLILCASIEYSAQASENTPHALILTGSPISPYGKLEYQVRIAQHFAVKTGILFGKIGVAEEDFWFGTPVKYYNENLVASPILINVPLNSGENPLTISVGGLLIYTPQQFFYSDYVESGFKWRYSAGANWQYSIPDSRWFVVLDGMLYFNLGEYQSKRTISPWLGAGIGWKF